jgi:Sigma-70, region 4
LNESDWAVRPRKPRLTFEAFCTEHEAAWRGIASAHLPDEEAVQTALRGARDDLWQDWARILRMPVPAFHAWTVVKAKIGETLMVLQLLGRLDSVTGTAPEWVRDVRHALTRAGHELDGESGWLELHRAINGLTDRRRDVVLLKFWLDLPDATIAGYLDTTEANVRSTASQALDRIAAALGRPRRKLRDLDEKPGEVR